MAEQFTLDYGKLAYAKIEGMEKRIRELEAADAPPEEAELTAPRLNPAAGGVKSARVNLSESADFSLKLSMYCAADAATTVRARLTVDGREAGECSERVPAGGKRVEFLMTVRAAGRGEHALRVYVTAEPPGAEITDFSMRLIGAGAALASEAGRIAAAKAESGDAILMLSSGNVALYLAENGALQPLPALFPECIDADLVGFGEAGARRAAAIYVTACGRAFARIYAFSPFRELGRLYLGGEFTACAGTESNGELQLLLIRGGRLTRGLIVPERGAAGVAEQRELDFYAQTVSCVAEPGRLLAATRSDGVIRVFRSCDFGSAGGETLAFALGAKEG